MLPSVCRVNMMFQGFTAAQLDYFSPYQAAVITSAQDQSLDQTQQSVIQKKLSYVSDEISLNPSASGKSGKCTECCVVTSEKVVSIVMPTVNEPVNYPVN